MEIVTLACNECGAPLQAGTGTRFVRCAHCSAQLEICRGAGGTWTKKLARLEERVARLEVADRPRRRRPWRRWNVAEEREEYAMARIAAAELAVVALIGVGTAEVLWLVLAGAVAVLVFCALALRDRAEVRGRAVRRERRRTAAGTVRARPGRGGR